MDECAEFGLSTQQAISYGVDATGLEDEELIVAIVVPLVLVICGVALCIFCCVRASQKKKAAAEGGQFSAQSTQHV